MITQVILWSALAVVGCAAFAALGICAQETDGHHRAQRRAVEMHPPCTPRRPQRRT
jgi:hypothetical protein